MNTSFLHPRETFYSNVVPFPTAKTSGALTITSSDYYPYENGAWGPAEISIIAADKTKTGTSGDTTDIYVYVSFSGGDTFIRVANYKDLRYAAAGGTLNVQYWIPLAPRIRIQAVLVAGDSFVTGHGAQINLTMKELYPGIARTVYYDSGKTTAYGFMGDTKKAGDSTWGWYSSRANIKYSTVMSTATGFWSGAVVWAHAQDRSKITNTIRVALQYSDDGVTYWHGDSLAGACNPTNGTGIFMGAKETTGATPAVSYYTMDNSEFTRQGAYMRLAFFGDTPCALAQGHGIKYFIVGFRD